MPRCGWFGQHVAMDDEQPWYSVRCVFRARIEPSAAGPRTNAYEERITVWRAQSFAAAIQQAEAEALEYAEGSNWEYVGYAQSFHMFGDLVPGAEVFSLIRESRLTPTKYIDRFFESGNEWQGAPIVE
jgi:Domain of unknown function (DUF4288)